MAYDDTQALPSRPRAKPPGVLGSDDFPRPAPLDGPTRGRAGSEYAMTADPAAPSASFAAGQATRKAIRGGLDALGAAQGALGELITRPARAQAGVLADFSKGRSPIQLGSP